MPGCGRQFSWKGRDHLKQLLVHELRVGAWYVEVSVFCTCSSVFATG